MKGLTAFGIYLPYYRLKRETIFEAMGWFNPSTAALARGEKTVANYDEDSLIMAMAVGISCQGDVDMEPTSEFRLLSYSNMFAKAVNRPTFGVLGECLCSPYLRICAAGWSRHCRDLGTPR